MHHGDALARESRDASLPETVASGRFDDLDTRMRALCTYAVKLTLTPGDMEQADVDALRDAGLRDRAIVDVNQVTSYFNYVNRVVDGLGADLEPSWPEELRVRKKYAFR